MTIDAELESEVFDVDADLLDVDEPDIEVQSGRCDVEWPDIDVDTPPCDVAGRVIDVDDVGCKLESIGIDGEYARGLVESMAAGSTTTQEAAVAGESRLTFSRRPHDTMASKFMPGTSSMTTTVMYRGAVA